MVIRTTYKYQSLKQPSVTAFTETFASAPIPLTNYRVLDVLLTYTGSGTANITVSFDAQTGEAGTPAPVTFLMKTPDSKEFAAQAKEGAAITVGAPTTDERLFTFRITADMIASIDADRVIFKTTAADGSTVLGALTALLFDPRYNPDDGFGELTAQGW